MATGTKTVRVLPSAMRATVRLSVSADTLEQAVTDIQKETEAAKSNLAALKPVVGTLLVNGPHRGRDPSESSRMREMMTATRRFSTPSATTKPAKQTVTMSATVSAEWPLAGKDLVALHREVAKLQEAVRKALPKRAKKTEPASEADEERALLERMMREERAEAGEPGAPVFGFIARLPAEELDKARREAFVEARQEAKSIAKAAGGHVGRLANISAGVTGLSPSSDAWSDYTAMRYFRQQMGLGSDLSGPKQTETVSPTLGMVGFTVSVRATFVLLPEN